MKLMNLIVAISLIVPSLMFSQEQKHVEIGSREMSEEALGQIESRKRDSDDLAEEENGEIESAGFVFDRYPPVYYSSSHHWLSAVTVLDNSEYTLELEDGSIWKISSYDGVKALNWRANDPLTVTQNNRWFSRHEHRIVNKSNGTSVEATLYLGPVELGEFSRFIVGIDYVKREILLDDSSCWEISYLDSSIFKDWALNDYIIIGTNSNTSIWDSGSDALLINVNLNNSSRAKQF